MSEFAARRGEVEVPAKAPAQRKAAAALGIAVITLAFMGLLLGSQVKPAFIDSYKTDGNVLWVGYAPNGECNTMIRVRATETDDAVVLDIVGWDPVAYLPQTAQQALCTARFDLKEPLGDRELRLASGESVAEEWASVGR